MILAFFNQHLGTTGLDQAPHYIGGVSATQTNYGTYKWFHGEFTGETQAPDYSSVLLLHYLDSLVPVFSNSLQ